MKKTITLRVVRQRIYAATDNSAPSEVESTKVVTYYSKYERELAYGVTWGKRLGSLQQSRNGSWFLRTHGRRSLRYLVLAMNGVESEKDFAAIVKEAFEPKEGENQ
jgi:hypothetical protein